MKEKIILITNRSNIGKYLRIINIFCDLITRYVFMALKRWNKKYVDYRKTLARGYVHPLRVCHNKDDASVFVIYYFLALQFLTKKTSPEFLNKSF